MQASEWLGEIWSSRKVSHLAMIEMTMYLLIPWILVLPWSLCMNYNMVMTVGWWMGWAAGPPIGTTAVEQAASISAWYLTSFLPLWTAGLLYNKQRPGNLLRALLTGHLLLVGNYIAYTACWFALYRHLRGARGWQKTRRIEEGRPVFPAAAAVTGRVAAAPAQALAPALVPVRVPVGAQVR